MKTILTLISLLLLTNLLAQSDDQDYPAEIRGQLTDQDSGQPITYASIYCKACAYGGTITNELGEFILSAPQETAEIRIDHLMYASREMTITSQNGAIKLRAESHELPEVVVDGTEAFELIQKAYDRLVAGENDFFKGEGFYRQTTKRGEVHTEILECFVKVKYSNRGMADWKIKTGRYAVNPIEYRVQLTNHSYFTRGWTVFMDREIMPDKYTIPLNPKAYAHYAYRIENRIQKESGEVIVVGCYPSESIPEAAVEAKLYLDKATGQLLRGEYRVAHLELNQSMPGQLIDPSFTAIIDFRRSATGTSLIETMQSEMRMMFKAPDGEHYPVVARSIFLNFPSSETTRPIDSREKIDVNDLKKIAKARYKEKWWRRHPVIATTPLEQAVIDDFNRQKYFGNYFE